MNASIRVYRFGATKNQTTIKTARPVTARVASIQIISFPGISFLTIERKFVIMQRIFWILGC